MKTLITLGMSKHESWILSPVSKQRQTTKCCFETKNLSFLGIFSYNLYHFITTLDICSEFAKTGIVPDVLTIAPSNFLKVFRKKLLWYQPKATVLNAGSFCWQGTKFRRRLKDTPKINCSAEAESFYTLAFIGETKLKASLKFWVEMSYFWKIFQKNQNFFGEKFFQEA